MNVSMCVLVCVCRGVCKFVRGCVCMRALNPPKTPVTSWLAKHAKPWHFSSPEKYA